MAYARLLRLLVLLLLVAVIAYPFIQGYLEGRSGTGEAMEDLPALFQEAILHYNVSTRWLLRPEAGVNVSQHVADALNLSERLASLASLHPSEEDSSLLSITIRASESYSHLANASAMFYEAVGLNSLLYRNITYMLRLLGMCRVYEALDIWASIEDEVYNLTTTLKEGLAESARATPDNLLSDSHKDVYVEGVERAYKLYGDLNLLVKLMGIIEEYRDSLVNLCNASTNMSVNMSGASIPPGLLSGISSIKNSLSTIKGGPYSYDLYSTITSLGGSLSSQQGAGGMGLGKAVDSPSYSPGQGAGYEEPPSDD